MKVHPIHKKHLINAIAVLLIFLFVYAATSKLWDFGQFKVQLGQSPILTAYAQWVAWGVPAIEYLLTLLLVMGTTRYLAFFGSLALMTMFTTYIILVLNFSDYIPCSCGGVLQDLGWTEHILFNLFFIVLSIIAILLSRNHQIRKAPIS